MSLFARRLRSGHRNNRSRRLSCEHLERRELLAGVALDSAIRFDLVNAMPYYEMEIAHGADGSTYIAGAINANHSSIPGTIDLDPNNPAPDDPAIVATNPATTSLLATYIAKYDADGNFAWVQRVTGPGTPQIDELVVTPGGSIYFGGKYSNGSVSIGGNTLPTESWGLPDVFVGKLNSDGELGWVKAIDTRSNRSLIYKPMELAVAESSDRLYVAFNDEIATTVTKGKNTTTTYSFEAGVVALNGINGPGGPVIGTGGYATPAWKDVLVFNGQSSQLFDLAIDGLGALYAVGSFHGTVDFNPSSSTLNLTSGNGNPAPRATFIWKLNANGTLAWAKSLASTSANQSSAHHVIIDSSNNVIVGGSFNGTVDFNPASATFNLASAGGTDGYLLKLTSAGNFTSAIRIGGAANEAISDMTLAGDGFLYLVGTGYLAKYSTTLALQWNVSGTGATGKIAVSPSGQIHRFGAYHGDVDLDGDGDIDLYDSGDPDWADIFWASYDQLP